MKHSLCLLFAFFLLFSSTLQAEMPIPVQNPMIIVTSATTGQRLQVGLKDLGQMDYQSAVKACNDLGKGWRLPTKEEWEAIYHELYQMGNGGFRNEQYWSSSTDNLNHPYYVSLTYGFVYSNYKKHLKAQVRPVRGLD